MRESLQKNEVFHFIFKKCDQVCRKRRFWSYSLKKSLIEKVHFLSSEFKILVKCNLKFHISEKFYHKERETNLTPTRPQTYVCC